MKAAFADQLAKEVAKLSTEEVEQQFSAAIGTYTAGVEDAALLPASVLEKAGGYVDENGLVKVVVELDRMWPGDTGDRVLAFARANEPRIIEDRYGYSPQVRDIAVAGKEYLAMNVPLGAAAQLMGFGVKRVLLDKRMVSQLNESIRVINATDAWNATDSSGRGAFGTKVTIAVLDTGIDYGHTAFGSCTSAQFTSGTCPKVVAGYDFVNNDNDSMDDNGHGTHVASIAAGNDTFKGVAPNATLMAYKVLDANGDGTMSSVLAGLAAALDPNNDGNTADHADVILMSLGGPGEPDDPLSLAVDDATSKGAVVVVSLSKGTMTSPGMARTALTVGSVTKNRQIASSSRYGTTAVGQVKPEVYAPGENICAAKSSTNNLGATTCRDGTHILQSGTSMAAPHIAGVVALLKQMNSTWDALEYRQAVKNFTSSGDFAARGGWISNASLAVLMARSSLPVSLFNLTRGNLPKNIDYKQNINGSAYGKGFKDYTVDVRPITDYYAGQPDFWSGDENTRTWTTLATGTSAVTNGVLVSGFDYKNYKQGPYLFRLTVHNNTGQETKDYLNVNITNIYFTEPRPEIIRTGTSLTIKGYAANVNLSNYSVELGEGFDPTSWSNATLSGFTGTSIVENGTLATLDLTKIRNGEYTLRLRAQLKDLNITTVTRSFVWDPTKSGWPQKFSPDSGYIGQSAVITRPAIADLDGDGKMEIAFSSLPLFGNSGNLTVYSSDGTLKWWTGIGAGSWLNGYYFGSAPAIADMDGDGKKEVVIGDGFGKLWMFTYDGKNVTGWPKYPQGTFPPPKRIADITLSDVDNDGKLDIVFVQGVTSSSGNVHVFSNGAEATGWPQSLANGATGAVSSTVSIADMDGDGKQEILAEGGSEVKLFSSSSTVIWSKSTGTSTDSPTAFADIDGDGLPEAIMVEGLNIHAYKKDFTEPSGWPIVVETGGGWPAIGDFDNDGKLDALIAGGAFNGIGRLLKLNGTSPLPAVADVNFDGRDDYVNSAGDWYSKAPVIHSKFHGFTANSSNQSAYEMAGFPHFTVGSSSHVALLDIDNDGYMDYVNINDDGSIYVWSLPDKIPNPGSYQAAWPMFHGNAQHTGSTAYSTAKRARMKDKIDFGRDTDSNGRNDWLTVEFTVAVNETATYKLRGKLIAPSGAIISVSSDNTSSLSSGTRKFAVGFPGKDVFMGKESGRFNVTAQLWRDAGGEDAIQHTWNASLGSYTYTDFERNAKFTSFSSAKADADGDGYADYLNVNAGVDVSGVAGTYTVSADLQTGSGQAIGSAQTTSSLAVGSNTVTLQFSGMDIFAKKTDGPYKVVNAKLVNAGDQYDLKASAHTTAAYAWGDFQRPAKLPTTGYSSAGVDTNSNGLFDVLRVTVPVSVGRSGTFTVSGELWDGATKVDSTSATATLSTGARSVNLDFSGTKVFDRRKNNVAYAVKSVELKDSDSFVLSSAASPHTTGSYNYLQFEKTVKFTGSYSDTGVDNDTSPDGLYNRLVVSVGISALAAETFTLSGDLYDGANTKVFPATATGTLATGSQSVNLAFDGVTIRLNGKNGFTVKSLKIVDSSGNELDSKANAYTTGISDYTKFQKAGRLKGWTLTAIDNNSNSLSDGLQAKADIEVTRPGSYTLSAGLADKNGNRIQTVSASATLGTGSQAITLPAFNGNDIFMDHVSGSFTLEGVSLQLSGTEVDTAAGVAAGTFNYDQFEKPATLGGTYTTAKISNGTDSYYDALKLNVDVETLKPGTYTLSADLYDPNNKKVASAENVSALAEGTKEFSVAFPGTKVYMSKKTGAFTAKDITLTLSGVTVDAKSSTSLGTVTWSEYQPPAYLTGTWTDFAVDTDGNGKLDRLIFEGEVFVTVPDTYTYLGTLLDTNDNAIVESAENTSALKAGTRKIQLWYAGETISSTGKKKVGFYDIEQVSSTDSGGNQVEFVQDAVSTQNEYDSKDFDTPSGQLKVTSCTETDNGVDYGKRGTSTGKKTNGATVDATDFCTAKGNLREYSCMTKTNKQGKSTNYLAVEKEHACANGCSAGACV